MRLTGLASLASASLVPTSRVGRRLALAALVDSFGTGMFLTGSAVYFTRVIGLSPGQVGIGLSVAGLAGLVLSVPLGILGDRIGPGRLYVEFQVWRGVWYAAYALVSGFTGFLVTATAIEIADAALPAISQAVVGMAVPDEERMATLARVRAVRNVGFGLGAVVATGVLALGSRQAFLALVVVNAVAVLLGGALLRFGTDISALRTATVAVRKFGLVTDRRYLGAALLSGILSIHMSLLFTGLPLWISSHTHVPVVLIGALVTINTVLAVTLQARFAVAAERLSGAMRTMVWAGLALAGFGVAAFLMSRISAVPVVALLAVMAVVLLTCGELWQSAGGWAISYELAPEHRRTEYLATFQLGTALQVSAGPVIVVSLVFPYTAGWLVFALIVAVAGFLVPRVVRDGQQDDQK
jgi:MFS family permease